jgi:uncharacterized protein (TIGR02117 family)
MTMLRAMPAKGEDRRRFLALLAAAGVCLAARAAPAAPDCRTIYVVGHERHAGIIVDRRDFDPVGSAETPEFLTRGWLEFGWGDADFYQARGESVLLGLKALFVPTDSVVHVHAFSGAPPGNFPKSEVLELPLTGVGYARLLAFLGSSFKRDDAGRVARLGPGLYGLSYFYAGEGRYHAFRTCNTWAAEALAAGGFPIDPAGVGTVGQFMDGVRGRTQAACAAAAG